MITMLSRAMARFSAVPRLAALLGATALALLPARAEACGGFFCNLQDPVAQAAERVLYVQDGNQVTAHIQITYTGPASEFSWVLPLQKQPKLGVGSDSVFTVLENFTRPQFQLQQEGNGNCWLNQCYLMAAAGGAEVDADGGTKGGVKILAHEAVGPYDTVIIQGDSGAAVQKWLNDNGYDQPASTGPLLDAYAKKQFVFLALKLQKDKDAGDLQPIVVTIDEVGPCLPIRLTALAAEPDMPILIWALGQHRAIPKNFLHVQINEKTVDWLTGGGNYVTVASKAVDQASGHAFLTEFAGASKLLQNQFALPQWNTQKLEGVTDPGKFLMAMLEQNLPRTSQTQKLIRKFIPKPAGFEAKTDQEFYNCVQANCCVDKGACESGWTCDPTCAAIKQAVAQQPFDAKAFAQAIQDGVVAPLQEVQAAATQLPYLTRLFTLVSPEEMDKDPIFAWNKDLPDVSNVHTAKVLPVCAAGTSQAHEAKLTFADGSTLTLPVAKQEPGQCFGPGFNGGNGVNLDAKAAIVEAGGQPARVVEVLDETGAPIGIDPTQADQVDALLNLAEIGKPSLPADFVKQPITWNPDKPGPVQTTGSGQTPTPVPGGGGGGGCTATPTSATAPAGLLALGLVLGGTLLLRRRRGA